MHERMHWLSLCFALLFSLASDAAALWAQAPSKDMCLACHGVQGMEKSRDGKSVSLFVAKETFERSVHRAFECTACHDDIAQIPHAPALKSPQCSTCHAQAEKDYSSSVHGKGAAKGDKDIATCWSCHGTHDIQPVKSPLSRAYPLNLPRTCGTCHGDAALAKRHNIPVANAYQLFMDSIHGRALTKSGLLVAASCSNCHGSHRIYPASDPNSTVNRNNVPNTCGHCHAGILHVFDGSVHGQALKAADAGAPVCTSCHTSHEIRRVETEKWKLDVIRECGNCHAQSLKSYRDTFHGKVTALGFTRVARCSDCHGSHDIRRVADPGSTVNPRRLVTTCGKCHAGSNASFVKYDPHADPADRSRNPYLYYASRFMSWLLLSVFVFFGLHTALWAGSSILRGRRKTPTDPSDSGPPSKPGGTA